MNFVRRSAALRWALLCVVPFVAAGCGPRNHFATASRSGEDSYDVVTRFRARDGVVTNRSQVPLPAGTYRFPLFVAANPGRRPLPGFREKIHPILRDRIALGISGVKEQVYVTFVDSVTIPRFPTLGFLTSVSDSSGKQNFATDLVDSMRVVRAPRSLADSAFMASRFNAIVLDRTFWLTRSMELEILLDSIPSLAALPQVTYVRPAGPAEPPPQLNGLSGDNPDRVREWIGANAYDVSWLQSGRIALLDTGIDAQHVMLSATGQLGVSYDYVTLSTMANAYADDVSPSTGHGTMSAGIMIGNSTAYPAAKGLTNIRLDNYRIYQGSTSGSQVGLVGPAVEKALTDALSSFGGVITIEVQAEEPDYGAIAQAAEKAFEGGAVVIAANGNSDQGSPDMKVRAPANARRVLGIGGYTTEYGNTIVEQLSGPTSDYRVKPDVQAPTAYETACKGSGTTEFGAHSGTSGATAVAGAAAALLRNLMLDPETATIDPGFVYAALIASTDGRQPVDPVMGAGRFYLPNNSWFWTVKLALAHDESAPIEFDLTGTALSSVKAALWWPEKPEFDVTGRLLDNHSEVELELRVTDAYSTRSSTGFEKESVFQRTQIDVSTPVTKLAVNVHAKIVREPTTAQTVYLVVFGQESSAFYP